MDLKLDGKRALVTGSSSGIGEGIARALAQEGCHVVVHGRDVGRVESVAAAIRASGGKAATTIGDLATDSGADAVAEAAGGVDILVNNAGGAAGTSAQGWNDVPLAAWIDTYEKNAGSAARMINRLLPAMRSRGWGRIINIASAAATQPLAFGPDYGAAKGAMVNMTCSLAKALGSCGVTVNSISPGSVLTPAVERWLGNLRETMGWAGLSDQQVERKVTETMVPTLVGRIGRVEEIAHVVCMIASPRADYMMGANIRVDGGQVQSIG